MLDTAVMNGVAIRVRNPEGGIEPYAYECHDGERLAQIVESTVRLLPVGYSLAEVIVA